jgi:hypothetical protein
MNYRHKYDDKLEDGLGMDELIGRHLKNYADRSSPPLSARQQILSRAQEQNLRSPLWIWFRAYFQAIGRLLWLVLSLRWLEESTQDIHLKWIDDYGFDDFELKQWFYYRSSMNSFLFGSGNFTLSG